MMKKGSRKGAKTRIFFANLAPLRENIRHVKLREARSSEFCKHQLEYFRFNKNCY